tara:strand:+ start:1434 stop:1598 length:165 start_codon:yes stop_codon:yes gene_type:complete
MASVDRLNEVLDYYSLWFEWITRIAPSAKELTKFDKMNQREQYQYLKEKVNENK